MFAATIHLKTSISGEVPMNVLYENIQGSSKYMVFIYYSNKSHMHHCNFIPLRNLQIEMALIFIIFISRNQNTHTAHRPTTTCANPTHTFNVYNMLGKLVLAGQ
jgi:hypothetical protein